MREKTIQIAFFGLVAIILLVLLFFILKPFLGVVFLSSVLAVSFYPLYQKLVKKLRGRKNLSAILTTLVVIVCVVVPVSIISASLLREAADLYNSVVLGSSSSILSQINTTIDKVAGMFPQGMVGSISIESYAQGALSWIIGHFDSIFAAVFDGFFKFVLMLLTFYYFLIAGERIKNWVIYWSPLNNSYDIEFLKTLRVSIDAVIRGRILVSVAQGLFLGLGFAIFGVGSPVLWGFVGGIASLIPILGTSIVVVPAVAYLFVSGNIGSGIGLIIWGALAVGLVDNVLAFFFFKGKIKAHPLLILFSILGGVELFGVIGFLVGPVVISALLALVKIYPSIIPQAKE